MLTYQLVVLTLEIMSLIRSSTFTVPVSQIHVEYNISKTIIADDLFVLSEPILLIAFVINPVLISQLELQLGFPLPCLLHSNEFEFDELHNALSTLLFTFLHLATVGMRHSGHVFPISAYICSAQTENWYNSRIVPSQCENSYFVHQFWNVPGNSRIAQGVLYRFLL